MKKSIVITSDWPEEGVAALEADYDVTLPPAGERLLGDNLGKALQNCDVLIPMFFDKVDDAFIAALPPRIKLIASYGVGTNHIDVPAATARGIMVANTPDVVVADTADLAMGLVIATCRRFYEREQELRSGNWNALALMHGLGQKVSGKTLGIIGMGAIGFETAKRAKAFDMDIIYHSRNRKPEAEAKLGAHYCDTKEELLKRADIVSLHTALNEDTYHIIDGPALEQMKDSAILINTGRGPLVDETALVQALTGGQIAGAGLDVYEYEPKLAEGLADCPNTTLMPHIGTSTRDTRIEMAMRVKANIDQFFATGRVSDPVTE